MSYSVAKQKIKRVKEEVEDGQNTAERVGDAMLYALDFANDELEKKSDIVEISTLIDRVGTVLPLGANYVFNGKPVHTISGHIENTEQDFIAMCIGHDGGTSEDVNHSVKLFIKYDGNYQYMRSFETEDAEMEIEIYIAKALGVWKASTTSDGIMSKEDKKLIEEMVVEVFPLTASIVTSNAGKYEVGTSVTPNITLSITRKGVDVAADSILGCSSASATINPNTKEVTDTAISSGTKTISLRVEQGGQEVKLDDLKWDFMNYRYRGAVSTAPTQTNILTVIQGLSKDLSTATTQSQTTLAGGSYYVFAVKGTPNLVVHNAKSGGVVDSYAKGTISVPQENDKNKTNTYSYIVVPKSSNTWYFTIENS